MQLNAENLVIERGGRVVIDHLSFSAKSGEALVLVGPNGSGKTTLLRSIAGFIAPAAGSLHLEGAEANAEIGELCHFVGHTNAVKSNLTVNENIAFWSRYLGGAEGAAERRANALEAFGLGGLEDFPAAYLSAGQKRRTGLARLAAAPRPLWLLDEPTVSLDAASTKLLADAVNSHLKSGGIVIAATHLPLGFEKSRELDLSRTRAAA